MLSLTVARHFSGTWEDIPADAAACNCVELDWIQTDVH